MNWTIVAPILGGIGALFGAYATFQQQRTSNINKRFEMLFGFQGKTLESVQKENDDLRTRLRTAEKNIYDCEQDRHSQGLEIKDLKHMVADQQRTIDELQRLIPNGTNI